MSFTIKDSGARETFTSGMQRDTQKGKLLYRLVRSGPMLLRWVRHLTGGAEKYDRDNWMKAEGQVELDRFLDSAERHFAQWMAGEVDEDHAAAVFFNINGAEYVRSRMSSTQLPKRYKWSSDEPYVDWSIYQFHEDRGDQGIWYATKDCDMRKSQHYFDDRESFLDLIRQGRMVEIPL